jgi:hypothetical protein
MAQKTGMNVPDTKIHQPVSIPLEISYGEGGKYTLTDPVSGVFTDGKTKKEALDAFRLTIYMALQRF